MQRIYIFIKLCLVLLSINNNNYVPIIHNILPRRSIENAYNYKLIYRCFNVLYPILI